jgi:DNA topoisomerase VI subunit B
MHDGISFEKKGVPAAVICTEPFVTSAVAMSKIGGIPDFPFVVVPHPLGSLNEDELIKIAEKAAEDVVGILLSGQ